MYNFMVLGKRILYHDSMHLSFEGELWTVKDCYYRKLIWRLRMMVTYMAFDYVNKGWMHGKRKKKKGNEYKSINVWWLIPQTSSSRSKSNKKTGPRFYFNWSLMLALTSDFLCKQFHIEVILGFSFFFLNYFKLKFGF